MARRFLVDHSTYSAFLATSLFSASAALASYPVSSTGPVVPANMLNYQYCETILVVPTAPAGKTQPVFNTTGYDSCSNYQNLQAQDIINSYNITYPPGNPYGLPSGATSLQLNWPRNWVYNQAVEGVPPGTTTYLNLFNDNTLWGFVGFNTGTSVGTAYTQSFVVRDATWTYNTNSLVFELLDPTGNLYVMQSYARFIDPSLTYDDLQDVAYMTSVMGLPPGWSYGIKQLTQQFANVSTGNAVIVNDKLGNSYMMVNPSLSSLPVGTPYTVPGPIPIFGVGIAFGFSRRLRARIKKADS